MLYAILSLTFFIVACLLLFGITISKRRQKRRFRNIQNQWGSPKTETFNFSNIEKYSKIVKDVEKFHELPQQTLTDIDFKVLFTFIDRTSSKVGQQYLFNLLKKPVNSIDKLLELNKNAIFFSKNELLRKEIQQELGKLNHADAYYISSLFDGNLIERPGWFKWLFLDSAVVIILLILSLKFIFLLLVLIIPFILNMGIHYRNKMRTMEFSLSFSQLNTIINTSRKLAKKVIPVDKNFIKESIILLKRFQRKLNLLNAGQAIGIRGELIQALLYIVELLKSLFLIEVYAFFNLTKELKNKQPHILKLFNYIGEIDTAISIASLRAGSLITCQPTFIQASKELSVKNIYHPLLKKSVANSISVDSKSILVAGSNMSGKTTFLRTIAVNALLAQTIYTCFADSYTAPFLKLFSSIKIDENLMDGKSYYMKEVSIIAALVNEVKSPYPNLFIIDEVFRGTNTVERIATAKAILSYLNRKDNIVFVSTHDTELFDLLSNEYDLYHFTETILNNKLCFDHLLKTGRPQTKNAIKLLQLAKYPDEIVNDALAISNTMESANK